MAERKKEKKEKKEEEEFQIISVCYPEYINATPEQEEILREKFDEIRKKMELEKKAKKRSKRR